MGIPHISLEGRGVRGVTAEGQRGFHPLCAWAVGKYPADCHTISGVKRYHGKHRVPVPHSVGGGLLTMIASCGSWSFSMPMHRKHEKGERNPL